METKSTGQKYDLSIVLPVYNEVKSISKVIEAIYEKIIPSFQGTVEVVVAEDGSTDGTKELLTELQPKYKFRLVMGAKRKGYNQAVKDALSLAQGTYVFMTDSGGGHELNDFFNLWKHLSEYSVVSGFKKQRQDPWHRVILSRIYNLYVSSLFKHRFYDIDCGFKVYNNAALQQVLPEVKILRECISAEIMLRLHTRGYTIKEVPITHYRRDLDGPAKTFSLKKIPKLVSGLFVDTLTLKRELSKHLVFNQNN